MSVLERFMSRSIYGGASPTLRKFMQPQTQRLDVAALSRARELELSGAGDEEVERARAFERTYGETGVVPLRSVLENRLGEQGEFVGVDRTGQTGALESIGNFLQRGSSAVVGGVSGLLGLERLRETQGDGTLLDAPKGLQQGESAGSLALRRFAEGLSGKEIYRAADFGVLAYDRETTGLGERALKSTAGFLLDTVLDPITYMSLGGSIWGRAQGARRVFYSMSNKEARENILTGVRAMSVNNQIELIMRAPKQHTISQPGIVKRILDHVDPDDLTPDQMQIFRNWGQQGNQNDLVQFFRNAPTMRENFAADFIAGQGANAYSVGSSAGLRQYLRGELGDLGDTIYKALPLDIQGGVRMRVPFSAIGGRNPKMLFRVPGTEKLSSITNRGREFLRNKGPKNFGKMGKEESSLRSSYYQFQRQSNAGIHGAIDPDTKAIHWFDLQENRNLMRSSLVQSEAGKRGIHYLQSGLNNAEKAREVQRKLVQSGARKLDVDGENALEQNLIETLDKVMQENISMTSGLRSQKDLNDIFGDNPTEYETYVYDAAVDFRTSLDELAVDLTEHFDGEFGQFFRAIQQNGEYWPRIVQQANSLLPQRGKKSSRAIFQRENFVEMYTDNGDVISFMTPLQIAKQLESPLGKEPFIINPIDAMIAYHTAVRNILDEEIMYKQLMKSGLVLKGEPVKIPDLQTTRELAINLRKDLRERQTILSSIQTVRDRADAETVFRALAGLRRWGKKSFEDYNPVMLEESEQAGQFIYRSLDGYFVKAADATERTWYAQNKTGLYLTNNNTFTSEQNKARPFFSKQQAEGAINSIDSIAKERNEELIRLASAAKKAAEQDIVAGLSGLNYLNPTGTTKIARPGPHALDPTRLPVSKQGDYIARVAKILNDFSQEEGYIAQVAPALGVKYKLNQERLGITGYSLLSESLGDSQISSRIAARLEEDGIFAPNALIEPILRHFKVYQPANTEFSKFVDDFYRPFYAVQKALMTSQRGPGYVIRNIYGGMWNGWTHNLAAQDFQKSASVNISKIKARQAVRKIIEEKNDAGEFVSDPQAYDILKETFKKELFNKFEDDEAKFLFKAWHSYSELADTSAKTVGQTAQTLSVLRANEPIGTFSKEDVGWYANAADYLSSRSKWAKTTRTWAEDSEDYLRFAAFLKGAREYGLDDGGLAASMYVKASQFDYSDLSDFEINVLKMIIPFYTWSRNNIPLQARAIMSDPGRVNIAIRINEALADAFGEPDDPEEPLPHYVRQRMGFRVRSDLFSGPAGDALAGAMVVGEPLVDINTIFRTGSLNPFKAVNMRELGNMINPAYSFATEIITAMEQSTGERFQPKEETPGWISFFRDPYLDLTGKEKEDDEISRRILRSVRTVIPPLGTLERIFPQALGNERLQRRWYSSVASTIFGLPAATLDAAQTGSELRAEEQRNRKVLETKFGKNYAEYTGFARHVLELGVTPQEMNALKEVMFDGRDFSEVKEEELDWYAARDYLDLIRRLNNLRVSGLDEDRLRDMVATFRPRSDMDMNVRAGAPQPLTKEQLKELGVTSQEVEKMSREERQKIIDQYFNQRP